MNLNSPINLNLHSSIIVTYQSCLVVTIYRPRELSQLVAQVPSSPSADVAVAPGGS